MLTPILLFSHSRWDSLCAPILYHLGKFSVTSSTVFQGCAIHESFIIQMNYQDFSMKNNFLRGRQLGSWCNLTRSHHEQIPRLFTAQEWTHKLQCWDTKRWKFQVILPSFQHFHGLEHGSWRRVHVVNMNSLSSVTTHPLLSAATSDHLTTSVVIKTQQPNPLAP